MTDNELAVINGPVMDMEQYGKSRITLKAFIEKKMKEETDFGIIPGTKKKSLYKPGAEKLAKIFGLRPDYVVEKEVEDFEKGFFYYKVRCNLIHIMTDKVVGTAVRSCNSMEKKYRTVSEWIGGVRKVRSATPEEQADKQNTILSMAQKRALVEVVKLATGASEIFEEEVEDEDDKQETETPRRLLEKRFFAIINERNLPSEQVKEALKKKKGVAHLSELSDQDIEDAIDTLTIEYAPVGKGQKPLKIGSAKTVNLPEEVDHEGVVHEAATVVVPTEGVVIKQNNDNIVIIDGDDATAEDAIALMGATDKNCRTCGKEIPAERDTESAYFCSKKCQDGYYSEPKKSSGESLKTKLSRGFGAAKEK